jgi:hypothetical protein
MLFLAKLAGMNIIGEVLALRLTVGTYAVIGSGPLDIRHLRPAHDIDLLVNNTAYALLKSYGWAEEVTPGRERPWKLSYGWFDVSMTWSIKRYRPDPQRLIDQADIIEGVAFVRLTEVLRWKKASGRPKDLADIRLIEQYLAAH